MGYSLLAPADLGPLTQQILHLGRRGYPGPAFPHRSGRQGFSKPMVAAGEKLQDDGQVSTAVTHRRDDPALLGRASCGPGESALSRSLSSRSTVRQSWAAAFLIIAAKCSRSSGACPAAVAAVTAASHRVAVSLARVPFGQI